jgi:tetratricopeptide (TPR) repeat protein
LYQYTVRHQPKSVRAYILAASELMQLGRLDEAAAFAEAGRKVLPSYYDIWRLSTEIALKRGHLDEAENYLAVARRLAPNPLYLMLLKKELDERRALAKPRSPAAGAAPPSTFPSRPPATGASIR